MSRNIFALILVFGLLLLSGCITQQTAQPGAISVWQQKEGGDWEIRYSLWDEASKKWYVPSGGITELVAKLAGNDHDPYVDSDGKNTAMAVWSHEESGSSEIYYSIWKLDKWSSPQALAKITGADIDPAIAMDKNGNAVAAWVHKNTDGTNTLYYSTYSGGAWTTPAQISSNLSQVSLPEISFSPTLGAYLLVFTKSTENGARAYASGYGKGVWAPQIEIPGQSSAAVYDVNSPTNERMGLGAANKKREAIAVWGTTKGELYSSTWTPSGWSTAVKYGTEKMPDAEYEYGGVPYSVFIKGGDLGWSLDLYSANGVKSVPGTGKDSRPALTFIGDRKTGLTVFWTTAASPSEIYYSRWTGAAWEPALAIDPAFVPGEDRNPAIAPLLKEDQYWDIYFDWCGDGLIQWPNIWGQFEQCEIGKPCANPKDFCNDRCLCIPTYPNMTFCGDGAIQKPNSAGVMEECEGNAGCPAGQACNAQTCKCIAGGQPPGEGTPPLTPPEEPPQTANVCGNRLIEAGEECDVGAQLIAGFQYGAAKDTCGTGKTCWEDCKCHPGIVTPRCGDGYISGPEQGANEECDLGGKLGAAVLPDTCTPPKTCSYICRCEEPAEDGMHNICAEGGCIQAQGEGPNECTYDYNCRHYECANTKCIQILTPGENTCITDASCEETHAECVDQECVEVEGLGDDECDSDSDCMITHSECIGEECVEVDGAGVNECQNNFDCAPETWCGDGVIQEELQEECEDDSDCHGGGVCLGNCQCEYPPELDCDEICGATSGADMLAQGLASSTACGALLPGEYPSEECHTTCRYSYFYKEENEAGMDSCCCGMVKRFDCSDCPGENPVCPGESVCSQNSPNWVQP